MHLLLDIPQGEYRELSKEEIQRLKLILARKN
jgi:hypothetical protein